MQRICKLFMAKILSKNKTFIALQLICGAFLLIEKTN